MRGYAVGAHNLKGGCRTGLVTCGWRPLRPLDAGSISEGGPKLMRGSPIHLQSWFGDWAREDLEAELSGTANGKEGALNPYGC